MGLTAFGDPYVTQPTAAGGGLREAEEGKVTSGQGILQGAAYAPITFQWNRTQFGSRV